MQGWPWSRGKRQKQGNTSWQERESCRYDSDTVRCALGEVLDISARGMRVICTGKPPVASGGVMPISLKFSDGSLQLHTQVRWCKRRGLKRYEIGLQFLQLKPGMPKVLEAIARFGTAQAARHMDDCEEQKAHHNKQQNKQPTQVEAALPNYYRVLGIEPDATTDQIKASYRRLATKCHPDRSNKADAMQRFQMINEAYHVLVDVKRRETYSRMAG